MLAPTVLDQLRTIVGERRVLTDAADCAPYGLDRTTLWQPAPGCVVLPSTTEQVQAVVQLAIREQLAIVPSGGRTGLSGGAVAKNGEIVVALDRMNRVLEVNPIDATLRCEAGLVTATLQEAAAAAGLFYPVDFASAGSSQIGGNIATNAGGIKVIRYGMTRDWVLGLKVVTGSGEVLDLNRGLIKNNTGYDLRHLFIGSEGTLGLICEATVRLTRPPEDPVVMVLAVAEFAAIMEVLRTFNSGLELNAFEFFSRNALEKVMDHSSLPEPCETRAPYYALLEFDAPGEAVLDTAMGLFEQCVEQGAVLDGSVSQSLAQAQNLWRLREDISETLSHWKPYKNDLSVSISKMPGFIERVDALVAEQYPDFEVVWFGHIGDGNLHLNILKPEYLKVDAFAERCGDVSQQVAALVAEFGGSVSAEHGIGLLKKEYLGYSRSSAEIALMRQIKQVFDPHGIMNPGKLIDLPGGAGH